MHAWPSRTVAADKVAYQLRNSFLVGEAYYPMARRQASEMAFCLALCSGCGALVGGDVDVADYCGDGGGSCLKAFRHAIGRTTLGWFH